MIFGAGNICNHLLRLDFVKRIIPQLQTMYHVVHKSIPVFDIESSTVQMRAGVKLEAFIFDAFGLAKKSVILECKREEEFAPMKNKMGADSIETALAMILSLFEDGEVSPLDFYFGEEMSR